jgi:L-amino acid N-acyltransferase YncA
VRLRPASADDAAAIAAIYAPYVAETIISFEAEPPPAEEIARRMAQHDGLYPWLVAAGPAGEIAGYAYAGPFRTRRAYRYSVETTIYVAAATHRRGMGRLLYAKLIETLTAQGFTQAIGVIGLPNPASVALHESVGFRHIGTNRGVGWKFGAWHDVGLWQRTLSEVDEPVGEPIPFAELPAQLP